MGTPAPAALAARLVAARAAAGIGDNTTALREFREVAEKLLEAGRNDDRTSVLVDIVALDPADIGAASGVARALAAAGELKRPRPYLSPDTAGDDPTLWLALGEALLAEGQLEQDRGAVATAIR